ncbi:T9SS type A sorting domain-containing protein [Chitinophaga sedimenti]|uniref:T9SS type A sorting domain-containing protein n=1 Tax=Chitinophaga sedimenti TaxID=2033606 RepID=UPI0020059BCC|nr:T9SS type A sorting domain-containing protein [Chitinophaga sedimenti]MCK7555571.1 T9SS type A sorting domain-containing protein [Chitinophaga sedimenti]
MTVYLKDQLVYGAAPSAVTPAGQAAVARETGSWKASLLQNPVSSNEAEVLISGASGKPIELTLSDANGKVWSIRKVDKASTAERQRFVLPGAPGVSYLKVNVGGEVQTIKILRLR